ncbi:amino acid deaminase/aldolase [Microbacterium stercoris]|uniref:Amino acid deaminase/aldolase n=1 Tax=Microbacterium stercoris TaxID=2820289 RepID=A0A939QMX1_9MICO|nr:amino acid deaminase/aldolase [Microbacterium stercoris]MBO3665165.1 amino acid deaminase/aldolase [Microbacterium stercoris]
MTPEALLHATAHLPAPLAIVDAERLRANADQLVGRAGGLPVRVATKSVRVRSLIEEVLRRPGWAGAMTYSLRESLWLSARGVADILLAYPSVDREALAQLAASDEHRARITVMVDSPEHLSLIAAAGASTANPVRVCLDIDASLRIGPAHLGVRRSPVHEVADAVALARAVVVTPGVELDGLMFYDAQIAGLPDTSPAVRLVKRRSHAELLERRAAVVAAVRDVAPLRFVNAGGTGSLERTGSDPSVTELTAGSGLFAPTLFDRYDAFQAHPAAFFALDVVRRPAPDIATCFGGGYIASGPAGGTRVPTPVWPERLELIGSEGTGEVQTPLRGAAARALRVGDRVLWRHAKAGELCERFDAVALVEGDGVTSVPTYRGEGWNFG